MIAHWCKIQGRNCMKCIDLQHELSHYNLRGKWNDYIGVQKEVISVLK